MLNSPDLITRLAGQALDRAVPETWTTLSLTQLQRFQQAFAELIVAECVNELRKWKGEPFAFDEDLAIRLITDHFGVELFEHSPTSAIHKG